MRFARALQEAQGHGASLLSYSPGQKVHGFAQRALMPLVFGELSCTYRPKEVSDPASPVAAANGQYLLISRETYQAVGGHAAVAGTILEDVALARAVKLAGYRLFFRFGGDAVRTHMYRSFGQMAEGWTKNLALLFPAPEKLARRRCMEFAGSVGALATAVAAAALGARRAALAAALVATPTSVRLLRRVRKAHFDWFSTMLAPLGLPLFAYLLRRSRISHKEGSVPWKGRVYPVLAQEAPEHRAH